MNKPRSARAVILQEMANLFVEASIDRLDAWLSNVERDFRDTLEKARQPLDETPEEQAPAPPAEKRKRGRPRKKATEVEVEQPEPAESDLSGIFDDLPPAPEPPVVPEPTVTDLPGEVRAFAFNTPGGAQMVRQALDERNLKTVNQVPREVWDDFMMRLQALADEAV